MDPDVCPLTAYEYSPAPYISLVDTETILCGSGASITGQWGCFQYAAVTQDFSRFPKYVCIVVLMHADGSWCPLTAYELWWILVSIHSIWIFSDTLHMSVVDLARVWSLNLWTWCCFSTAVIQVFCKFPNYVHTVGGCGGTGLRWILVSIHSIWMLSSTLYMSGMDMGIIAWGSGASITWQWHCLQ